MEAKNRKNRKPYQNKEWLTQKYRVERLSTNEIGELCGCSKMTISRALGEHGVKSRSLKLAMVNRAVMAFIARHRCDDKLIKNEMEYLRKKDAEEDISLDELINEACREG